MKLHITKRNTQFKRSGFTLVETMVAVTIFAIVILAPMTIATRGLQNAFFANEQATATFLAQEALEAIVQKRDENALRALYDPSWNAGDDIWDWYGDLPGDCRNNNGCGYDPSPGASNDFISCAGAGEPCRLEVRDGSGNGQEPSFMHNAPPGLSDSSIYTRKVFLAPDTSNSDMVKIRVEVEWGTTLFASGSRVITLETWVMNHYDRLAP